MTTNPPAAPSLALSMRQPWAWLIANGHKDIENRDWLTTQRGPVYVHASLSRDQVEFEGAVEFVREFAPEIAAQIPSFEQIERGGIVGTVEIAGCVPESDSPWFVGDFGFVLQNAKPLALIPCRGALKFFPPNLQPSAR